MAEKKTSTTPLTAEEMQEQRRKAQEAYENELIEYTARRPIGVSTKETDVTVTINGKNYQIQYNKPVTIPRFVAEVLDRAEAEAEKVEEKINNITSGSAPIAEL